MHHTGIKTKDWNILELLWKIFQLHHTGIKTNSEIYFQYLLGNFNCTIQELKPVLDRSEYPARGGFQLHHTGIKTGHGRVRADRQDGFQLHHTGIKTLLLTSYLSSSLLFQLHHTGIKTTEIRL